MTMRVPSATDTTRSMSAVSSCCVISARKLRLAMPCGSQRFHPDETMGE